MPISGKPPDFDAYNRAIGGYSSRAEMDAVRKDLAAQSPTFAGALHDYQAERAGRPELAENDEPEAETTSESAIAQVAASCLRFLARLIRTVASATSWCFERLLTFLGFPVQLAWWAYRRTSRLRREDELYDESSAETAMPRPSLAGRIFGAVVSILTWPARFLDYAYHAAANALDDSLPAVDAPQPLIVRTLAIILTPFVAIFSLPLTLARSAAYEFADRRSGSGWGIDLVGLLTGLATLSVLAVLFLPWVHSARSAALRAQCQSNLAQIGLGLHAYHTAHNTFPMGVSASYNPTNGDDPCLARSGWSAQALLLGNLDKQQLYNSLNFAFDPIQGAGGRVNHTAVSTGIETFLCPADGNAGSPYRNNYYASRGTSIDADWNLPQGAPPACGGKNSTGLFTYQKCYTLANMSDGTSNTIAFSEALVGSGGREAVAYTTGVNSGTNDIREPTATSLGDPYLLQPIHQPVPGSAVLKILDQCNADFSRAKAGAGLQANRGMHWSWGAEGMTLFSTMVPPSSSLYRWSSCRLGCGDCVIDSAEHSNIANANSNHGGGVNVLFGDGSTKFVKSNIPMSLWWGLGTRSGAEVLSSDSY